MKYKNEIETIQAFNKGEITGFKAEIFEEDYELVY